MCLRVDGLLYGVTGPTGVLLPQGFTIDLVEDERYSVDLIATWSPDEKVLILTSQIQSLNCKFTKCSPGAPVTPVSN